MSFMDVALLLGRRGLGNAWPNPAVGAVIVQEGAGKAIMVGRGWTQPGGRPHAETEALRRAGPLARGATMYVTLEPCSHYGKTPPCVDAIVAAGISRVVCALEDPNPKVAGAGFARLHEADIAVSVGDGARQAAHDHAGHIRRIRDGRPHVMLKLAVSADHKVGLAGPRPAAITGEEVRARVHLMRAMHDAILIGIGTALADDPQLTCRLPGMHKRSPFRVVLDSNLRLPLTSALARSARETPVWVIARPDAPGVREQALRECGVEVLRADGSLAALRLLAERGITRLMIEGGPTVAANFAAADLVDEAAIFHSETVVGPDGIDAGAIEEIIAKNLRSVGTERFGRDHMNPFSRSS
jgi:diaminohydroxyphosphoribosylaminopyrimidine deaminase/5-amino-6-(5-phosphoribosylamino)uracil reductase